MTINTVSGMIHHLTGGHVNGEHYSPDQLQNYLQNLMRNPEHLKMQGSAAVLLTLPDGEWLCTVNKYADASDGYDLFIPADREQEKRLWERLTA